jgi:hypothetical protein
MTNDMKEHVQRTSFSYGRYTEKRKRVSRNDLRYPEYNQLCLALLRELRDCAALNENFKLKFEYAVHFNNGRDSVNEY